MYFTLISLFLTFTTLFESATSHPHPSVQWRSLRGPTPFMNQAKWRIPESSQYTPQGANDMHNHRMSRCFQNYRRPLSWPWNFDWSIFEFLRPIYGVDYEYVPNQELLQIDPDDPMVYNYSDYDDSGYDDYDDYRNLMYKSNRIYRRSL